MSRVVKVTYPDLPLYPECQLLIQPDRDSTALLQQTENEVNGSQQRLTASHGECVE